jgi:hypothetical protein
MKGLGDRAGAKLDTVNKATSASGEALQATHITVGWMDIAVFWSAVVQGHRGALPPLTSWTNHCLDNKAIQQQGIGGKPAAAFFGQELGAERQPSEGWCLSCVWSCDWRMHAGFRCTKQDRVITTGCDAI